MIKMENIKEINLNNFSFDIKISIKTLDININASDVLSPLRKTRISVLINKKNTRK